MKYTITLTKQQYDFINSAVESYVEKLRQDLADQAQLSTLRKTKDQDAPWGRKKDGTPRKRPGRTKLNLPSLNPSASA